MLKLDYKAALGLRGGFFESIQLEIDIEELVKALYRYFTHGCDQQRSDIHDSI